MIDRRIGKGTRNRLPTRGVLVRFGFVLSLLLAGCARPAGARSEPTPRETAHVGTMEGVAATSDAPWKTTPTTETTTPDPSVMILATSPVVGSTDRSAAMTWERVTRVHNLWLASSTTGWVAGQRCLEEYATTPTPGAFRVPLERKDCHNVIVETADGGVTWQTHDVGPVSVRQIQFSGAGDGWAVGQQTDQCAHSSCPSALLRTTDGGRHWTTVYTSTLRLVHLAFASPTDGWVFGENCHAPGNSQSCTWHLLTTGDGGQTWHQSPLSFIGSVLDVARPTASDGWIASTAPRFGGVRLLVTHDGGKTWKSGASPVGADLNAGFGIGLRLVFRTPTEGWLLALGQPSAGFQPKELFHTNDGSHTWTKMAWTHTWDPKSSAQGLPDYGIVLSDGTMVFTASQDGWIAMPRGGLLHSVDGGRAWQTVPLGDDHDFTDLHFANPSVGWVGGPGGVWATTDGGATWHPLRLPGDQTGSTTNRREGDVIR